MRSWRTKDSESMNLSQNDELDHLIQKQKEYEAHLKTNTEMTAEQKVFAGIISQLAILLTPEALVTGAAHLADAKAEYKVWKQQHDNFF